MKRILMILFLLIGANPGCTIVDKELLELVLEIKKQNEELKKQNDELLAEMKSVQSKSDSLVNEIKKGAENHAALLEKVTGLQNQLTQIIKESAELKALIEKNAGSTEVIKSQLADLQEKYEEIVAQLEQLQQLSQILAEIEKLKTQIKELDSKYQVVVNSLGQNQQALDALKGQVTNLQNQLAQNLEKISQLTSQLGEQGADVKKILFQIEELKLSCKELKEKLDSILNNQFNEEPNDISNLKIGDLFQDGTVAYIFKPGEYGYERGFKGIIVAERDLSTRYTWKTDSDNAIFSKLSTEIGYGDLNTEEILRLAKQFNFKAPAAEAANNYSSKNYDDWFLPSQYELLIIKENLANKGLGNFFTSPILGSNLSTGYWSSSIMSNTVGALAPLFGPGLGVCGCAFFESYLVRPIRFFK